LNCLLQCNDYVILQIVLFRHGKGISDKASSVDITGIMGKYHIERTLRSVR